MKRWIVLLIFVLMGAYGCSTSQETLPNKVNKSFGEFSSKTSQINDSTETGPNATLIKTYFATDRNISENTPRRLTFGSNQAELNYGIVNVSVPRDHRMGALERRPYQILFGGDKEKHFILERPLLIERTVFFENLSKEISNSGGKNALIFIHGFDVSFEDAALRTAQMSYDLSFDGAPIFYSWPSKGQRSISTYKYDEIQAKATQKNLKYFLDEFLEQNSTQNVYIIAHSMGNQPLSKVLPELIAEKPHLKSKIREVILAAPDIDAEHFVDEIAPNFSPLKGQITLYASSKDKALRISDAFVNGKVRVGDTSQGVILSDGINVIDATYVDTSLTGHSYYAENRSVLADLFFLIRGTCKAENRFGLREVKTPKGNYWEFIR